MDCLGTRRAVAVELPSYGRRPICSVGLPTSSIDDVDVDSYLLVTQGVGAESLELVLPASSGVVDAGGGGQLQALDRLLGLDACRGGILDDLGDGVPGQVGEARLRFVEFDVR